MRKASLSAKLSNTAKTVWFSLLAIFTSFLVGGIIIESVGYDAILAYKSLTLGSFISLRAIGDTLNKTAPIILTGLSYSIAKRCGLINLGGEGQLYAGALAAILVSAYIELQYPAIQTTLSLLCGFLCGAFVGVLVAILKYKFGATELITTIMLNYSIRYFCAYLVSDPLRNRDNVYNAPQSKPVLDAVKLPVIAQGTRFHIGILIALVMILFYWVFLWKTSRGYKMRVVGLNRDAAEYAGIEIPSNGMLAMFLAGGFAGLAGAIELLGIQYILRDGLASTIGFDGVAVALLGNTSPVGIVLSGLLFGMIRNGSNTMEIVSGVTSEMTYIIQGLIILFVVGRDMFRADWLRSLVAKVKNSARKRK